MRMHAIVVSLALLAAGTASAAPFTVSSPEFKNGGTIPDKNTFNGMGCTGENTSPALEWKNAPKDTKSFALLVHDPDAPTGSGWWHWVVYNIPATATSLPAGAGTEDGDNLPKGTVQGHTDFGKTGWGGPCPPPGHGKHHYNFELHALSVEKLELPEDATAAMVGFNVKANSIGKAKLVGIYSRKKQ